MCVFGGEGGPRLAIVDQTDWGSRLIDALWSLRMRTCRSTERKRAFMCASGTHSFGESSYVQRSGMDAYSRQHMAADVGFIAQSCWRTGSLPLMLSKGVIDGRYLLRTVLAAGARADQASTGLGLEGCVARDAWLGNAGDGPHGNNSMTASSIPLSTFLPFSSPQVPRNPDLSFGPTLCSVSLWDPSNGHMLIALSCFLDCLPLVPPAVRYIIIILRCW